MPGKRKERGPRHDKPCARCTQPHHPLAYCPDGVRVARAAKPFQKGDPRAGRKKAPESAPVEAAAVVSPAAEPPETRTGAPAVTVTTAQDDLRTIIASMPEGSQQRKSMELLLEREEARQKHDRDEAEYRTVTGNPDARLPLPTIIRDPSEETGRKLNLELDRLLAKEGVGVKRDRSTPDVMRALRPEAETLHNTLASMNETREMTERQAEMAAAKPEHPNGDTSWFCNDCHKGFNAASLDHVRNKAKLQPGWKFVCPHCMGIHVQLVQLVAVA